jgi:hypothetical protein
MSGIVDTSRPLEEFFAGILSKVKETRPLGSRQVLWQAIIEGEETYFITSSSNEFNETSSFLSDNTASIIFFNEALYTELSQNSHDKTALETVRILLRDKE